MDSGLVKFPLRKELLKISGKTNKPGEQPVENLMIGYASKKLRGCDANQGIIAGSLV